MSKFTRFIAIIRADLLQRFRSDFFWITFVLIAVTTWVSFPIGSLNYLSLSATGTDVNVGNISAHPRLYRGVYSSAWIGLSVAYFMTLFSTTIGFFVVRGSISRDIETNVLSLLGTSSITKMEYCFARWCGYITVLTVLYMCSCLVGVLAQYIHAESIIFRITDYIVPYFFFAFPAMALTAMFAIWFEIQMELRHTLGNILYGFIWLILVIQLPGWFEIQNIPSYLSWTVDLIGYNSLQETVLRGLTNSAGMHDHLDRINILFGGLLDIPHQFFSFNSQQFTLNESLSRYGWLLISLCGVQLASLFFGKATVKTNNVSLAFDKELGATLAWLTKLLSPLQNYQFGILFSSELMYILRTRGVAWWGALIIVWAIQIFGDLSSNPIRISTLVMGVAGAWLLLLDIFSRTVLRDIETGTFGFIFTSVSANHRILLTRLSVVLLLTLICTLPAILRCLFIDPIISVNIIIVGASLVVLAMTLGALSRNSRLFELVACGSFYMTYEGMAFINVVNLSNAMRWWHISILVVCAMVIKKAWTRLRLFGY